MQGATHRETLVTATPTGRRVAPRQAAPVPWPSPSAPGIPKQAGEQASGSEAEQAPAPPPLDASLL